MESESKPREDLKPKCYSRILRSSVRDVRSAATFVSGERVSPAFFYSAVGCLTKLSLEAVECLATEAEALKPFPRIDEGVRSRVESLGMEVVAVEWGGTSLKPTLRVRIDLPDSTPGKGVTVRDCAEVSRVVEGWLDEHPSIPERYVLEVSSPGVDRPLSRRGDFVRFAGREVEVRRTDGTGGPAVSGPIIGVLEGVKDAGDEYSVVIRELDDTRVVVPRRSIARAKLVFSWNENG